MWRCGDFPALRAGSDGGADRATGLVEDLAGDERRTGVVLPVRSLRFSPDSPIRRVAVASDARIGNRRRGVGVGVLRLAANDAGTRRFLSQFGADAAAMMFWRSISRWMVGHPRLAERVLILGTEPGAVALAREVLERRETGYEIVGFVGDDPAMVGRSLINPCVIGTMPELEQVVRQYRATGSSSRWRIARAIAAGFAADIEIARRRAGGRVRHVLRTADRQDRRRTFAPQPVVVCRHHTLGAPVQTRAPSVGRDDGAGRPGAFLALDIADGAGRQTGFARPCFLFAAAHRLHNQPFHIFKFRSMRTDAEANGPVWAGKSDSRVTRVGRVIRKLRIDELPQLFNILRGDMSLIGPRPERPVFVEQLEQRIPYYSERHLIKPGLTGWAQVCYPYGASFEDAWEKHQYDLYYIKNQSPMLDAIILLETVRLVLFGRFSR